MPWRATRVVFVLSVALLAIVVWLVYGPAEVGYDARFSLVWGHELAHLQSPDYGAALSPTSHPLANLIGLLASLAGRAGPGVLAALSYVAFAGLGVAAFEAGRRSFGIATGAVFALLMLTRPLLVGEMLDSSIDIPFLALVLTALALELGRPRRGAPVLAVLAVAGLLRPEAWLLSLAYLAYLVPGRLGWERVRLAALAVAGPVLWCAFDLLTTGKPFNSLTTTQDLAGTLQRERGLHAAFADTPLNLHDILGTEIAWVGTAVGAAALFVALDRAVVPLATLALGLLGFLALGLADLPLLTRYLLVPGAMLALFCAAGVGAFEWLRPGRVRLAVAGLVGAGIVVALAGGVSATRADIDFNRDRAGDDVTRSAALTRVADAALSRGVAGCSPALAATHRAVPLLAYRLGRRPSGIRVGLPAEARSGLVVTASVDALIGDVGLLPGVTIRSTDLVPPKGFTRLASNRWWALAARC
jgi:hypothetical protein